MAVPEEALWERDDHTEGKHLVLEEYLKAWFPILGTAKANQRILFVDGFAGPGEYAGGEEGSPVVAMRVLAEHRARIDAEVVFIFIEKDAKRADHLKGLRDEWLPKLPERTRITVLNDSFASVMDEVLKELAEEKVQMAPALVMMDPFGIRDVPLTVIAGILANPKCEVYVTFMWEQMNRFLTAPEFESHLDKMFDTRVWRKAISMQGDERRRHLYGLYRAQLKDAGAKHVLRFHLFKGERRKYSLFFATGHVLGSDRMKKAMWKIAPFGDFSFRGGTADQLVMLGVAEPDFSVLAEALHRRFAGPERVTINEVLNFVRSDETMFHDSQVKVPVLKPMEETGRIEVNRRTGQRRFKYPDGCRIRFL